MRHFALLAIPVLILAACSDAPGGIGELELTAPDQTQNELQMSSVHDGNPLLGVWRLTGVLQGDGGLEFPEGFSLILTFRADMTFSLAATNTSGGFVCQEPQTSCTIDGTYEYTATTITLNEETGPEPGPDTGLYTFCGGKLVYMDFTGDEGGGISFTFQRTRRDCYVKDCA